MDLRDDATREILSHNESPDVGFSFSLNPYRGCAHACAYCFARPTHEYLGLGAGTDFDTKIFVKRRAPELLRAVDRPSWRGETIAFSGVTDPWQPAERALEVTRRCLLVCLEYRNPVAVITKPALVLRDLDVLRSLLREARISVAVSLPFLDPGLSRTLEPWAATPEKRLEVIARLADAGLSPAVMVTPVIPGMDHEMPRVFERARAAGAVRAGLGALAASGSRAGGLRGTVAGGSARPGRAGPSPHPRDSWRTELRFALRRSRPRRGSLRDHHRLPLRPDREAARVL